MIPPDKKGRPATGAQETDDLPKLPVRAQDVKVSRRGFWRAIATVLCSLCWTCEQRASAAETIRANNEARR